MIKPRMTIRGDGYIAAFTALASMRALHKDWKVDVQTRSLEVRAGYGGSMPPEGADVVANLVVNFVGGVGAVYAVRAIDLLCKTYKAKVQEFRGKAKTLDFFTIIDESDGVTFELPMERNKAVKHYQDKEPKAPSTP